MHHLVFGVTISGLILVSVLARGDQPLIQDRRNWPVKGKLPETPLSEKELVQEQQATSNSANIVGGMPVSPSSSDAGVVYQNRKDIDASAILRPQQPPSYFTVDGVRSVMVNSPESKAQTTSAFGFYVRNESAEKDAAGVFGTSVCAVNGCSVWGLNPTVIDSYSNGVLSDGKSRKLIVMEGNPSATSSDTTIVGVSMLGSSIAQPKSAVAFTVGDLWFSNPGVNKWTTAFVVGDGTSTVGYLTGAAAQTGSLIPGIPNYLNYRDATGTARAIAYQVSALGALNIFGTASPNGLALAPAAKGAFPSLIAYGSDANVGLYLQAQGTGQVIGRSMISAQAGLFADTAVQFGVPARLRAYSVSTLPVCNSSTLDGMAVVIDAKDPVTYRGAVIGGGTIRTSVYCDGSGWTAH